MRYIRAPFMALLVIAALGACATRTAEELSEAATAQEPGIAGADFVIEIHNPMPHTMNVMYWVAGSQTTLGSVAANETKRFQVPNRGDDSVRLTATDDAQTHTVEKSLDLGKAEVVRWEIRN
ncbi:MAG TPA: hypothetical protein VK939_14590 [Longimicrobiales bacterium]|nr:hypothetical protein [Longimicrobiales bacterium]